MIDLTKLKSRDHFGKFLNDNHLTGDGCEIGVLSGGNASVIMNQWNGRMIHLVDPWSKVDPAIYKETQGWDPELNFRECQKLAEKYPGRVRLHRMFSADAANYFPDKFLDWVYIDGNHSYDAVSEDLRLWYPKVKKGGIFSGHDYRNEIGNGQHCEVKRAVNDWLATKPSGQRLVLHHTNVRTDSDPGWCGSWWIVK